MAPEDRAAGSLLADLPNCPLERMVKHGGRGHVELIEHERDLWMSSVRRFRSGHSDGRDDPGLALSHASWGSHCRIWHTPFLQLERPLGRWTFHRACLGPFSSTEFDYATLLSIVLHGPMGTVLW